LLRSFPHGCLQGFVFLIATKGNRNWLVAFTARWPARWPARWRALLLCYRHGCNKGSELLIVKRAITIMIVRLDLFLEIFQSMALKQAAVKDILSAGKAVLVKINEVPRNSRLVPL
jgi:hypothetical protein